MYFNINFKSFRISQKSLFNDMENTQTQTLVSMDQIFSFIEFFDFFMRFFFPWYYINLEAEVSLAHIVLMRQW